MALETSKFTVCSNMKQIRISPESESESRAVVSDPLWSRGHMVNWEHIV